MAYIGVWGDPPYRCGVVPHGARHSEFWLSVAEGFSMDSLKEGAKVKASYEEREGKNVTTSLEVSE